MENKKTKSGKKELLHEIEELKGQFNKLNDKYVRLLAEFDNYKKVSANERLQLIQTSNKELILTLLPVLDDFDRGLRALEEMKAEKSSIEGVNLIHKKLKETLENRGLKEMEVIGKPFDADIHEAIGNLPAGSKKMRNKIVEQVEKGYMLNENIIRHAKVLVGK